MAELPTGTVTFLFSDVEGSTALLERLGDAHADELASHRVVVREAISAHGGEIVDQRGEEVFAVFSEADAAVAAAVEIEQRHVHRLMRVRIGLHTGEAALTGDGYLGLDVHRAARICAAAYSGQVLLSERTHCSWPTGASKISAPTSWRGSRSRSTCSSSSTMSSAATSSRFACARRSGFGNGGRLGAARRERSSSSRGRLEPASPRRLRRSGRQSPASRPAS